MKSILCCEFKTTTLLTDDDSDLQLGLSLSLPPAHGPYRFLNDPGEALECLQKQTPLLTTKHLKPAECSVADEHHFCTKLDELKAYADRPSKVDKISVVFMDYQMPSMTGLEVFERVHLPHTEQILLTGMADEKIAVQAFNRRLIHRYISKQDPQLVALVIEALQIGQQNYFERSTQTHYNIVTQYEQETALTDPVFIQFFHRLKEKLGIIEYYLLDNIGSFLMIDSKKIRYHLNTYTKEKFQSLLETLPPQNRSVETLKGRQLYHCILGAGFTPVRQL